MMESRTFMTIAAEPRFMTTEQLLAFPDDGTDRELIEGQLRERGMTVRNDPHSSCMSRITGKLVPWVAAQPEPRGDVVSGEAGFRLRRNPDTTVGIDVAYISAEMVAANRGITGLLVGVPVLAVEILSPTDTHEGVGEKVDLYLRLNVPMVWVVDPRHRTVIIYQPGQEPVLFNATQSIDGGSCL